jgi:hypothetical protein
MKTEKNLIVSIKNWKLYKWTQRINGFDVQHYCLENKFFQDHPLRYSTGQIVYDRPELIPAYVKQTMYKYVF